MDGVVRVYWFSGTGDGGLAQRNTGIPSSGDVELGSGVVCPLWADGLDNASLALDGQSVAYRGQGRICLEQKRAGHGTPLVVEDNGGNITVLVAALPLIRSARRSGTLQETDSRGPA